MSDFASQPRNPWAPRIGARAPCETDPTILERTAALDALGTSGPTVTRAALQLVTGPLR